MRLRVKLFAVARQRIGKSEIEVELPSASTVHQLRGAMTEQFPPLVAVLAHARIAVNSEYVGDDFPLSPSSEVALIPPVSGG